MKTALEFSLGIAFLCLAALAKFGMPAGLDQWLSSIGDGKVANKPAHAWSPEAQRNNGIRRLVPDSPSGVYYRYCSDARHAGAAPIRRGEPGYASHLDRDGDGIACEPYRGR